MANVAMEAAEQACAWAKKQSAVAGKTNFDTLRENVHSVIESTDPGDAVITHLPGIAAAHWPCLSRLLLMDDPTLADRIFPHFVSSLDSRAGIAWMQIMYAAITGQRPKVQSWRHIDRKEHILL